MFYSSHIRNETKKLLFYHSYLSCHPSIYSTLPKKINNIQNVQFTFLDDVPIKKKKKSDNGGGRQGRDPKGSYTRLSLKINQGFLIGLQCHFQNFKSRIMIFSNCRNLIQVFCRSHLDIPISKQQLQKLLYIKHLILLLQHNRLYMNRQIMYYQMKYNR